MSVNRQTGLSVTSSPAPGCLSRRHASAALVAPARVTPGDARRVQLVPGRVPRRCPAPGEHGPCRPSRRASSSLDLRCTSSCARRLTVAAKPRFKHQRIFLLFDREQLSGLTWPEVRAAELLALMATARGALRSRCGILGHVNQTSCFPSRTVISRVGHDDRLHVHVGGCARRPKNRALSFPPLARLVSDCLSRPAHANRTNRFSRFACRFYFRGVRRSGRRPGGRDRRPLSGLPGAG